MEEINKKDYELAFLTTADEGPHEVMKLVGRHKGTITLEGPVERITLAYKIKKETSAYFGYFHVSAAPSDIKALEHDLNTNPLVLRSLIITPPFEKPKPRPARPMKAPAGAEAAAPAAASRPAASPAPLSNEALEKKIEEILQQ